MWMFHRSVFGALAGAGLSTGLGLLLAVTSLAAPPSLTIVATDAVIGQTIQATAELSETESPNPSGEISFEVFGPGDPTCSGPALSPSPASASVSGEGEYSSGEFTPPEAGAYHWSAHYSGDLEDPADSTCSAVSTVGKESPDLTATASDGVVNTGIHDEATVTGGFSPTGEVIFRVYGPADATCLMPLETDAVRLDDGHATSADFLPTQAGEFRWTAEYVGDENNEAVSLPCGSANQASAVGTIAVTLAASATSGTAGDPVTATASIQEGAIPAGQITFTAFSPGDANCSAAAAFSSTVSVSGNGSYRSAVFVPSRVGTFRWTASYSGDPNHAPATVGCGNATSTVSQARPSIANGLMPRLTVGTSFGITATLQGGYAPTGTITFEIYRRTAAGCAKPVVVGTVPVAGNGTISSDPLVARQPGTYSFVASYSGDAANQGTSDPCDPSSQAVRVDKRTPKVKPRARLKGDDQISIRAHLLGAASPSGVINFRLYRAGDKQCKRKPAFSGGVTVRSNGNYLLAQYFATKPGVYRLSVGYSGDQRNRQYKPTCRGAQQIRIG
jgi:Bacterial Ig-like domain (group 3)